MTLKERVFKESTLWPEGELLGSGTGLDCGPALPRRGPYVGYISVAVLRNKADGRLPSGEHTRVSEGKAVAFSMRLQKIFLWFLYFLKK